MGRQRLQGGVFLLALISVIAAQLADAAPRAGGRPVAGGTAPGGGGSKAPPGGSTPKPQNTPKNAPKYSSKTVLVQLKAAPAVAAAAAAAGKGPILQGLQFVSMIGEHQGVKLPAGGGPAVAAAAVAKAPANAVMKFKITDGSSVKVKLKQLKANPAVARAQPEYIYSPTDFAMRSPNDPMYGPGDYSSGQWYLPHVWAPSAWATTTGSSSIRVCMIDSGALRSHQDLKTNIVGGWNRAVYGELSNAPWQPEPGSALYNNFNDINGHGTHTTGTVGGAGDNGVGISGMNWKVSLFICKAASDSGGLYESALLDCYYLCRKARAHVVSNSYAGTFFSQFAFDAIAKLRDTGALFVAAAGNEYTSNDDAPRYPASYKLDNVMSVAATNADDTLSPFSNWGIQSTHIAAPGSNILNTWIGSNTAYNTISGTSMATPLVAGAAALIWSARPGATYAQIKNALMTGVDKRPTLANRVISGGRLNVAKALAKLLGRVEPPAPPEPAFNWVVDDGVEYQGSYRQFVLTLVGSPEECLQGCQNTPWCTAVTAYGDYVTRSLNPLIDDQAGNCIMYDKGFQLTGREEGAALYSAYKRVGSPALQDVPAIPAEGTSWGSPIAINTLPYQSGPYTTFVKDYSPVACSRERNLVRVFKWFSGGAQAGYATASSCGYGVGDTAVSVLSAPKEDGPFSCVGGQDDGSNGACDDNSKAFVYSFTFQPNTYYFIAVSPFDINSRLGATFKLSFNAFPGQSIPEPPPPSTGPGSWANPLVVPAGAAGLPYLSDDITEWTVKSPQPVECTSLARPNAVVFRWFSGDVQGGLLTATSCGNTVGDPVVTILKSSTPDGNAKTLSCITGNDDDDASCPANSDTIRSFTATLYVAPQTYYWFAAAPYDDTTETSIKLRLSVACQPPAGTWAAPAPIPALPFTSQSFCAFNKGVPPLACAQGRNSSVVFRWFSGAQVGYIFASSCNVTTGDPVISVLSSTNLKGPFNCVGGNDDDLDCPSNGAKVGAFGLKLPFRPFTYYWFAVAPSSELAASQVQLKLTKTYSLGPLFPPRS